MIELYGWKEIVQGFTICASILLVKYIRQKMQSRAYRTVPIFKGGATVTAT